jgi:preprotein translocase subunit SecG
VTALVLTIHIIVCLLLIVIVLLQSGQEGMGVIFGGSGDSFFGSGGAGGILTKITALLATIFLVTSLGYNVMTGGGKAPSESIMDDVELPAMQIPVTPQSPENVETGEDGGTTVTIPAPAGETGEAAPQEAPATDASDAPEQPTN